MPITRPRPDETREMRLFSKLITERTGDYDLPRFIASRREPGEHWRSWEEIVFDLGELTGELVTDISLRKWAKRYGIPESTDADAKQGPDAKAYVKALKSAGITI